MWLQSLVLAAVIESGGCVNPSGSQWWDEGYICRWKKRSLKEVTIFKIWEVMLTVVCSGGCEFYQVLLPAVIALSCHNLGTASCSQSKHAFGTSVEKTGNNISPLRMQTSADSSGWLLHFGFSVFPLTLTVKQWERGKWIRERRGIDWVLQHAAGKNLERKGLDFCSLWGLLLFCITDCRQE